jgi:MerR family transcriptional regulator, redox-sensitive transcriptional activator SoxR
MQRARSARPPLDLSVGELARRSGVAVSALHFYEAEGLIAGWRTSANHRRYPRGVLRRIAIIKVAQRAGISLKEIADAFATLPQGAVPPARDWARFSAHWKRDLDDRIERLARLRDQLTACIGCGCLSLADCPLRNPGDVLAEQGSGPRILDPSA